MNEQELMIKLVSIIDYTNPGKNHWVTQCENFGFGKDSKIFVLLKDFSDKNTREGDNSKNQIFNGLSLTELCKKILNLYIKDEKVKKLIDCI